MAGFLTNGLPTATQIAGYMMLPVDTEAPRGAAPQSIAATALQVAGAYGEAAANAQTSTAAAATSNTLAGVVTTESLSTAVNATYTFTLTNSAVNAAYISSGAQPTVSMFSVSNTGGTAPPFYSANMVLRTTTIAVGSIVWVFQNMGNTALNGTMFLVWHL